MKASFKMALAAMSAACLTALALSGCSSPAQEEEVPEEPSYDILIGVEAPDDVHVLMTNGMEQPITGIQFMPVGGTDFSANLMTADQVWESGSVADVYFDGVSAQGSSEDASDDQQANVASADDAATNDEDENAEQAADTQIQPLYDVRITCQDAASFDLHQIDLAALMSVEDIQLKHDAESNIAYLAFKANGTEVNTLEAEKGIIAAVAEAEAAAAAEAEAEAEAEAAAAASYSSSRSSGSSYSYDSSSSDSSSYEDSSSDSSSTDSGSVSSSGGYDSAGSDASSAPSQSVDSCVDVSQLEFND